MPLKPWLLEGAPVLTAKLTVTTVLALSLSTTDNGDVERTIEPQNFALGTLLYCFVFSGNTVDVSSHNPYMTHFQVWKKSFIFVRESLMRSIMVEGYFPVNIFYQYCIDPPFTHTPVTLTEHFEFTAPSFVMVPGGICAYHGKIDADYLWECSCWQI